VRIGITGLPFLGKSTVLAALAGASMPTTKHGEAARATVAVPDPRLDRLATDYGPKKVTPATVEYVEVGGGLGAQATAGFDPVHLQQLRTSDVLLVVVRAFDEPSVPHPKGRIDATADLSNLATELMLADQLLLDTQQERLSRTVKLKKDPEAERRLALVDKLLLVLSEGTPAQAVALSPQEVYAERDWGLLTKKPVMVCVNIGDEDERDVEGWSRRMSEAGGGLVSDVRVMAARLEREIAELEPTEREAFLSDIGVAESAADRVVRASHESAGLITFFTANEREVRATTVPEGTTTLDAAGAVHSDMARGFIRAEVLSYEEYESLGGWSAAKSAGRVRVEGKESIVSDGDILFIRFNV
jgi:GTP-binding protein YchF